jgi:hypothetical protein
MSVIRWLKSWLKWSSLLIFSAVVLSGCSLADLQSLKAKSGLQVVTEDQTASLFLNNEYLDKTPYINKNIKPGTYLLKVVPTDTTLATYETEVTLTQGTLTVVTWNPGKTPETSGGVTYELSANPAKPKQAEIVFTTIPDTAIITFDSQPQTFSPLTLSDVEPGNHEFEVKLPSYQTQKHTLNAVAGQKLSVSVKLAKQFSATAAITPTPSSELTASPSAMAVASSSTISAASLSAKLKNSPTAATIAGVQSGPRVLIKSTGYYENQIEVLRVRAEANAQAATVGWANVSQAYKYLDKQLGDWYFIQLSPTISGWVSTQYAELIKN